MKRFHLRSLLALAVVLAMTVTAWAFYSTSGAGSGGGTVGTLTEPVLDQPTPSGGSVPLNWSAAELSNESLESGITYTVQRKPDSGDWGPAGGTCSTSISATSCTDSVSTSGSYSYRVRAEFRNWTELSNERTVVATVGGGDTQAPSLTKAEMFDTDADGKVDAVEATFDENLAASTATDPWTLENVPSGGSLASVTTSGAVATLTISEGPDPADTAVGPFTIALAADSNGIRDAAGNQSSFAAEAPDDKAKPILTTLNMEDIVTVNGKIDRVRAHFSEDLASSSTTSVWTLTDVPSGGTLSSVTAPGSVSTNVATLFITEGSDAADTSVGNFKIALAAGPSGIRDAAGNQSSFAATAPADKAAPAPTAIEMFDTEATPDGKVDQVKLTFSEDLDTPYTAANSVWTLANAPGGATVNSVSVLDEVATLTLNEGTVNTAGGVFSGITLQAFTVALSANANGIRDADANETSWTPGKPVADKAKPIPTDLTFTRATGGSTVANAPSQNDRFAVMFSEPLAVASICSSWSGNTSNQGLTANNQVTLTIENNTAPNTGNDMLVVSNIVSPACSTGANFGRLDLGSPNYVTGNVNSGPGNGEGPRVELTWNFAARELRFKLGSGTASVVTGDMTAIYLPDAGLFDFPTAPAPANSVFGTISDTAADHF